MEFKELNQKPKEELNKMVQEEREKLRNLRFDLASGKVKNVRQIRQLRKNIAQILTILSCPKNN